MATRDTDVLWVMLGIDGTGFESEGYLNRVVVVHRKGCYSLLHHDVLLCIKQIQHMLPYDNF